MYVCVCVCITSRRMHCSGCVWPGGPPSLASGTAHRACCGHVRPPACALYSEQGLSCSAPWCPAQRDSAAHAHSLLLLLRTSCIRTHTPPLRLAAFSPSTNQAPAAPPPRIPFFAFLQLFNHSAANISPPPSNFATTPASLVFSPSFFAFVTRSRPQRSFSATIDVALAIYGLGYGYGYYARPIRQQPKSTATINKRQRRRGRAMGFVGLH